jgi:hypothetical protein
MTADQARQEIIDLVNNFINQPALVFDYRLSQLKSWINEPAAITAADKEKLRKLINENLQHFSEFFTDEVVKQYTNPDGETISDTKADYEAKGQKPQYLALIELRLALESKGSEKNFIEKGLGEQKVNFINEAFLQNIAWGFELRTLKELNDLATSRRKSWRPWGVSQDERKQNMVG